MIEMLLIEKTILHFPNLRIRLQILAASLPKAINSQHILNQCSVLHDPTLDVPSHLHTICILF